MLRRDEWECCSLVFEIEPQHIFLRGVLIHQVSKQDIVKSRCFLQLSNHLSTCGFSHTYDFCGRRGWACGNMKKCVWGGEGQLILYRAVHRSASPRPYLATSSNVSVHTRVCLQRRNCPAGHLSLSFNMFSFLSPRPFACSSVFWPFALGGELKVPVPLPRSYVQREINGRPRVLRWVTHAAVLPLQPRGCVTVSGYASSKQNPRKAPK